MENSHIDNPDVLHIFETTKPMPLQQTLAWLSAHEQEFAPSTVLLDTDDGNTLQQYRDRKPELFICLHSLNRIRHLHTLLNRANEELPEGGYIWTFSRTATLKKQLILETYPWGINYIAYGVHYFWHRLCAKMDITKWLYFAVTKGKNRTYNRVEVLGRMYRAGFEVVDEEFRFGQIRRPDI